ncbi:MAG: HEAT repeat domain-containing protein [Planctomycetes bacterium]|nr:HEAT repeat domain-containing protein [Planctomycetota bacterium]
MKLSRIIGVTCFAAFFLPLLFAQAQQPVVDLKASALAREWATTMGFGVQKVEDRRRAAEGIFDYSEGIGNVVSACRTGLRDPDEEVRLKSAKAIIHIGPKAVGATHALLLLIKKDKSPDLRAAAIAAIGSIYWDGANAGLIGPNEVVLTLVVTMQNDQDHGVRICACRIFRVIGTTGKDAAPALLELMKQKQDGEMRHTAAASLGRVVTPASNKLVSALLEMYKNGDEDRHIEGNVLSILGKIGDQPDVVVPLLIAALRNPNRLDLRGFAVQGLQPLGPKAKAAVPALIDALDVSVIKDKGYASALQSGVLNTLASIGPDAKAAVPALRKIADDRKTNQSTREHVGEVISKILTPVN